MAGVYSSCTIVANNNDPSSFSRCRSAPALEWPTTGNDDRSMIALGNSAAPAVERLRNKFLLCVCTTCHSAIIAVKVVLGLFFSFHSLTYSPFATQKVALLKPGCSRYIFRSLNDGTRKMLESFGGNNFKWLWPQPDIRLLTRKWKC